MNIVVSDGIVVSGVGVALNGIEWPSGQFNSGEPASELCSFLSSVNATFGFNLTPHTFNTEWVPCGEACEFHGASGQLPDIGHSLEVFIGDFLVRGIITHADYTSSINGTVVKVTVEDERRSLRKVKIHTEDLGEDVPSGIISVARAYRKINGLTDINGDPSDPLIKEYERILQFGCTYAQVLSAIDLAFDEGRAAISTAILPTVAQIEQNINGTVDAIRFQFNLSQLDEAITRILQDTGYDWYWGMDNQRVNIINKKVPFELEESDILNLVSEFGSTSGLNETKQIGFGQDVVSDPTRFRVLGGHQEGFINSNILSPIDGLDTSALDGDVIFSKVWDQLSVGFYDNDGFYRTYIPTEKELQFALAGIETWSYFKKYQTVPSDGDPSGFGFDSDAGSVAAQHPTFQSRLDPIMPLAGLATGNEGSGLRIINNRRDENSNWTLAFYNRIRNHASRHYGRSYVAEGVLFNEASGFYRLVGAAWANVENQVQGYTLNPSGTVSSSGVFLEDYEINRDLGPVSPFVTNDFRVSAHCVLPSGSIYGPQGDDDPASFGNWTEDAPPFNPNGDGSHYIPISLTVVGQRIINPRSSDLYSFESFPEGTLWCQLPINVGPEDGIVRDGTISSLATLVTTNLKLGSSGLIDLLDPAKILNAYQSLSGVAIPVQARTRYGQTYPSQWVLGDFHYERDEDVQLDDQFVPWAFSPDGNQTSLQVMTDRAVRRIEGKIVPKSFSRYGDFQQVGLPLLSFDAFADQGIGASGEYGETSHGVNELNISFGQAGFSTRYKIQSYFPQFGKEAPLGERVRAILDGILNPIDFTDLQLLNQTPPPASSPNLPGDPFIPPPFFDSEERAVRVTIVEVNNIFSLSSDPGDEQDERYRGRDQHTYLKPSSSFGFGGEQQDFEEGAICIDGFLNLGDEALYHTDDFELPFGNVIQRYFTQGRAFANGTIVEISRTNVDDSNLYDVTIVDPIALLSGTERAIFGLEVLNGTVAIGDKTTIVSQGDAPVSPGASNGTIFLNGTVQDSAGVTAVEIMSVAQQGTNLALAFCQEVGLGSNGTLSTASGQTYANVVPIPFREFAASGDRGFLSTQLSSPSGGFGQTGVVNFIEIVRPGYRNF
jgi:hypothetical protein